MVQTLLVALPLFQNLKDTAPMSGFGGKPDALAHPSFGRLLAKRRHAGVTLVLAFNASGRADPAVAIHGLQSDPALGQVRTVFAGRFATRPAEGIIREIALITGEYPAAYSSNPRGWTPN